jgi:glutamate dehydrogenase (NAD(P)+)
MLIAREAFAHLHEGIEGATVAVQGFGNAGYVAADLLEDEGARVVAVSDSGGAVHDPDGLDVDAVKAHKRETGSVVDAPGTEAWSNEDLLTADVDLLVPAALENAVDEEIARETGAGMVVEAANGPLTPEADDALTERGIPVFPDVLANAGGVTVSYFEWVQNRQRFYWTESRVNDELERVITEAFDGLVETREDHDLPNYRTAAYVVAIRRVLDAYREGGEWP